MRQFLQHLPDTHSVVSLGFVETFLQARRDELFTGLVRIQQPSKEALILTFANGHQQRAYCFPEQRTEVVEWQSYKDAFINSRVSIASLKLTGDALRAMRVGFEAPVLRAETETISSQELSNRVHAWSADGLPTILHVTGAAVDQLYLIAGNSAPIIEQLSWAGSEVLFSICDASFPEHLEPADYQVTRSISDGAHVIWQEFELRFAFAPLMRIMISRFSELAGRVLTERLCQQITQRNRNAGVNIAVTINGVANHHYFNSIEDASHAYLEIIRQLREEASTAIGARLVDGLARDTLHKQNKKQRDLLQQYIFDQYLLDYGSGMVWR